MATTNKRKKQPLKIGKINLTDHEKEVIAANVDSEFFKIITEKIIPQREVQIALTLLHGGGDEKDLYFYKGMLHLMTWFPKFIIGEAKNIDTAIYENDEDGDDLDARDDTPSR